MSGAGVNGAESAVGGVPGSAVTRHSMAGCSVVVPAGWEVLAGQGGDRLVAVEPGPGLVFRANLVVTVIGNGALSFRDWQASTDRMLPRQLASYQLVDLERRLVGGHPGGRRLAAHVVGATPVTMEQWFTQVGQVGFTLTCTVDSWRYDEMADLFAEVADGLVVPADLAAGDA